MLSLAGVSRVDRLACNTDAERLVLLRNVYTSPLSDAGSSADISAGGCVVPDCSRLLKQNRTIYQRSEEEIAKEA